MINQFNYVAITALITTGLVFLVIIYYMGKTEAHFSDYSNIAALYGCISLIIVGLTFGIS